MQEAIAARAEKAITDHVFPGCVIGCLSKGSKWIAPFGRYTYDADSTKVTEGALYDCASLTKSVVTATLALQLVDLGKLQLDDPLQKHIPEYGNPKVTIRHLLTYTVDGVTLSALADRTPEEITSVVFSTPPANDPGTHFAYTNLPAFLLGLTIERHLGPLDVAAQERVFKPNGMRASTFAPQGAVPTEEGIQDVVHDESARVFSRGGRIVGHAGMFSTAPDLLLFLENLQVHPDVRLETNYLADIGASAALGWELDQPHFMGRYRSPKTFGKTGFTGTSLVSDFERGTAVVILSNRTYPKRPADASAINALRSDVCDIVFSS